MAINTTYPYTCVVGREAAQTTLYAQGVTLAEVYYTHKKPKGNYWLLNHKTDEIITTQWGKYNKDTFKDDLIWFMAFNNGTNDVNIYAWIFLRYCQLYPECHSFNKLLVNWNGFGLKYFDHIKSWSDIWEVLFEQDQAGFLEFYSKFEAHFLEKLNLPKPSWAKVNVGV